MNNLSTIVIIGSGNLATHLAVALKAAGHTIMQVLSRTEEHANELAERIGCQYTTHFDDIICNADFYIISVKDDAVAGVAQSVARHIDSERGIMLHTAGSVSLDVLRQTNIRCGVLYPMQTFSKGRSVDFHGIPVFIEGSDDAALENIRTLASGISRSVVEADSSRRAKIHLAAVLASNLANHCYRLAERVMQQEGLDFQLLLPLIEETARKVSTMSPREAQTGPMIRYDTGVMQRQESMIDNDLTRQIYRLMAQSIHQDYI